MGVLRNWQTRIYEGRNTVSNADIVWGGGLTVISALAEACIEAETTNSAAEIPGFIGICVGMAMMVGGFMGLKSDMQLAEQTEAAAPEIEINPSAAEFMQAISDQMEQHVNRPQGS